MDRCARRRTESTASCASSPYPRRSQRESAKLVNVIWFNAFHGALQSLRPPPSEMAHKSDPEALARHRSSCEAGLSHSCDPSLRTLPGPLPTLKCVVMPWLVLGRRRWCMRYQVLGNEVSGDSNLDSIYTTLPIDWRGYSTAPLQ